MQARKYFNNGIILSLLIALAHTPISYAQMPDGSGGSSDSNQGQLNNVPGDQGQGGANNNAMPQMPQMPDASAQNNNNSNAQGQSNPYDQTFPPKADESNKKPAVKGKNPSKTNVPKPAASTNNVSYVQQYQWSKKGNLIKETGSFGNSTIRRSASAASSSSGYQVAVSGPKSYVIKTAGINTFAEEVNLTKDQVKNKLTLELAKVGDSKLKYKSLTVSVNNFVVATQANFVNNNSFSVDVNGKASEGSNQILIEMSGPASLGVSYKLMASEKAPAEILTVSGPKTFTVTTAGTNTFTDTINLTSEQLADKLNMTLTKGGPATNKFKSLSVSVGGYIIATEKNFEHSDSFSLDLSKKITKPSTQLLVSAAAPAQTSLTYKITLPRTKEMKEEESDKVPFVLQQGKDYTTTTAFVNKYTETFKLEPGEEHLPLSLIFNISGPGNGFNRLLIYLNGVAIASRKEFKTNTLSLNVMNQLIPGTNEITVQSQGPKDSKFTWKLTSPKIVLKQTKPEPCAMGDIIEIDGSNFPTYKKPNLKYGYVEEVTIDGLSALVTYATANQLKVLVPDSLKPGEVKLKVAVGRVKSKEFKIKIKADPVVFGVDHINIQPTGILNIKGQGFSSNPAKIKVTMRGVNVPVQSASSTSLSVKIPEALDLDSPTASAMNPADQLNAASEPAQGGFTNIEIESDGVKAKYKPQQDCFPGITQPSTLGVGVYYRVIAPSNQVNMP